MQRIIYYIIVSLPILLIINEINSKIFKTSESKVIRPYFKTENG